ncbi:hypothetical protein AKJ62_04255, partial [candidate division MSBL1 archaeon SCGC-AAA259D14]
TDHFSHLHENALTFSTPAVSAGDFLRRKRCDFAARGTREILKSSFENREKMLDPLVDYVLALNPSDPSTVNKAAMEMKSKLEENERYGKYFKALENELNSLSMKDKRRVLEIGLTEALSNANAIRMTINDRFFAGQHLRDLTLLDQALYVISELIKTGMSEIEKIGEKKDIRLGSLNHALILTLKLEAVRRGRVKITDIERDITAASVVIPRKEEIEKLSSKTTKSTVDLLGEN